MNPVRIRVAKVSTGTVYSLFAIGTICGFVPLGILFGVLGFLGVGSVKWNNEAVTGASALLAGPLMCFFFALLCTAFLGSIVALGLWLFAKFRPITLEYEPLDNEAANRQLSS